MMTPNESSKRRLILGFEQRAIAAAIPCLLLLALSGCGIPGLRGGGAGPTLPSDFNGVTSADSSARVGIEEFFDDPVLTGLIAEGLAGNQELRIRNEEIQIARNEILAARGAYLPFVSLNARSGFERTSKFTPLGAAEEQLTYPGGGEFPDPLPNTRITADLFWELDIWGALRRARDAAMQRYVEAVERRNYFVTQLVSEIAENYYQLAALDQRMVYLNQTIAIQLRSVEVAEAQKAAGLGATELGVQRFSAEVRKNESQKLIVAQRIVETENRINFLVGRFPQQVDRVDWNFIALDPSRLRAGVPAQLLLNRRDIRAAERELVASGLDVQVARARFYPRLALTAGVGFEAFSPRYLFDPGAFVANAAGELVAPLINKMAIQADYMSANARQLQALYDYQRTVLNAFTEVVNSLAKVENYRRSAEFKVSQVAALARSVDVATDLFQGARGEYADVLFTQRELLEARTNLIEIKQEQLSAIVDAYRALGGGFLLSSSGVEATEAFYLTPEGETIEVLPQPLPAGAPAVEEPLPNPAAALPAAPANPANPAAPAAPTNPALPAAPENPANPAAPAVPADGVAGPGAEISRGAAGRSVPPPVRFEALDLPPE
jgi:NodT family efflux transporter outer membrane factor (OMF) lipoprotein